MSVSHRHKGFPRTGGRSRTDVVRRDFTDAGPKRWMTVISTDEWPLWLSAIRDIFSRHVVGREASAQGADWVLTMLELGLASSEVQPGNLVQRADDDCQKARHRRALAPKGIRWTGGHPGSK